jgi:A/G-specific adenine glycosylase
MLQQTGVSTVIPYFQRWMKRFPTVEELAIADEQEVLAIWQGLGYYRRCRNLHQGAKVVVRDGWPSSVKEWLRIPGVGRYTAGAITSIALGQVEPLVDGNVERVYARLTSDTASGNDLNRKTWTWAAEEMRPNAPGDWNQALMELGATICTPAKPDCEDCPLADVCVAFKLGVVKNLPTAVAKRKVELLAFEVCISICENRYGVRQIPEGNWWAGMWEFPRKNLAANIELDFASMSLPPIRHTVTHHRITLYPHIAILSKPSDDLRWFTFEELALMPMPAPQRKLLERVAAIRFQET